MTSRAEVLKGLEALSGEDRRFALNEANNPLPAEHIPSAKERTAEAERAYKRRQIPKPAGAAEPKRCVCDSPIRQVDEDGTATCFRCAKVLP